MGLENNVPNSFLNVILQLFYSLDIMRTQALKAQLSPYHHQENSQTSLWCELGFLFHMMQLTETTFANDAEVEKIVRAANFQRTFQTYALVPEVAALQLFDPTAQKDLQQIIQSFLPFILRQLGKEYELENTSVGGRTAGRIASGGVNAVDEVFSFNVRPCTTFLVSNTVKVDATPSKATFTEMVYPSLAAKQTLKPGSTTSSSKKKVCSSFAAVLWGSLKKEVYMK